MEESKLNANAVGANCVRPHFEGMTQNKGITLIALIITIIVMLILVGVTINVALNGGLFEKGEKTAYQTQASTVKEQLEIAKAVEIANRDGELLDDYSGITVGNLEGLDSKTIEEYKDKIVVAKNGDICYNPEKVTDPEETDWLEEIGIREYVKTVEPETFTFTIGDIAPKASFGDGWIVIPATSFWTDTVSEELKDSSVSHPIYPDMMNVYSNVTCSDSSIPNKSAENPETPFDRGYVIYDMGEEIRVAVKLGELYIDESNWEEYKDLSFTITL